jgi:hypothetical protein
MRECPSCAARAGQAEFPAMKRGTPSLCCDCATEAPPDARPKRPPITRARYRAALRRRQAAPQLDLVDLIVAAP